MRHVHHFYHNHWFCHFETFTTPKNYNVHQIYKTHHFTTLITKYDGGLCLWRLLFYCMNVRLSSILFFFLLECSHSNGPKRYFNWWDAHKTSEKLCFSLLQLFQVKPNPKSVSEWMWSILIFFYIFRVSTDMTRQFCGHCGNDTLQRVSVTVDADGSLKYFISTRKPISTRNKRVHFVGLVC